MGREAVCKCRWGSQEAEVKALLESGELILRGGIRRRIPFKEMLDVRVDGERLGFTIGGETVFLSVGRSMAEKWVVAITTPPPSLARKLGISDKSIVRTIGRMDDDALLAAIQEAGQVAAKHSNLILARVDTPEALGTALQKAKTRLLEGVPIWVIYPKGPGHALNESLVRSTLIANGLVDNKVAAVSARLTALRFVRRKG